jgi:hypothetical protein
MEGEGGLAAKLDAWAKFNIPSLYGKLPSWAAGLARSHRCAERLESSIVSSDHSLC